MRTSWWVVAASVAALGVVGCDAAVDSDSDASAAADAAASLQRATSTVVTLAEFEGSFDPDTGVFELNTLPVDQWLTLDPAANGLRTVSQALGYCNDIVVSSAEGAVQLDTVAGSLHTTVEDCIAEENRPEGYMNLFYNDGGAFCATVRLRSRLGVPASNVMAEMVEVSTGYAAYRYRGTRPAAVREPRSPSCPALRTRRRT